MKKLKLNLSNLEGAEVLTREQLKKVMGGSGSGDLCPSNCSGGCKNDEGHTGNCRKRESDGTCWCATVG